MAGLGAGCQVIAYTKQICEVTYLPDYQPLTDVPIVQAATVYTDAYTGKTYFLIINESSWVNHG
jgi:hypothetical protein